VTVTVTAAIIPSVHIDMPASGTTVSGTVTVAGWAIDNASVVGTAISAVQVLVDGTQVGTATYGVSRPDVCVAYPARAGCPNVGFSYSLNTAALTAGSHTITVTATDSASSPDTGSSSVTVTVTAPAVIPTVHIDMPASGTAVSSTVTLAGWAIDNASVVGTAISSVHVLVDGTQVGTATYGASRPDVCAAYPGRPGCPNVGFSYSLNTATLTAGSHTITVSATDSASPPDTGSTSVTVTVTAPAVIPTVHIDMPASGTAVSGTVTLAGWAIDNASVVGTAISSVQVLVDGTAVGTATYGASRPDVCAAYPGRRGCPNVGFSYSLNTATLAAGSHTITVSATDSASPPDTGSTNVTVTVTAPAVIPSVHIDMPASGMTVSGTVTLAGWAIDNASVVGTAISSVQVLVDGTAVGTATYGASRPDVCAAYPGRVGCPNVGFSYSLNTATLASGSHTITVSATDSASSPDTGSSTITVQK
jgi:N-acetylmuramoyl-L-alanine amidase